jgi:mono/diheme cytochrome c family protein
MKIARMLAVGAAVLGIASWANVAHADAKAKFKEVCSECHEVGDFAGEPAADLTASMKNIVAGGKMKNGKPHKQKLTLTDAEIAELATYMSAGK